MIVRLAALCESAVDRRNGRWDLTGVISELAATRFPAWQEMEALFVLEWDSDEVGRQPFRADIVAESGTMIGTLQGHIEVRPTMDGGPIVSPLHQSLAQVVFPQPGRYVVRLTAGGDSRDVFAFFVRHDPRAEPPPGA
jgi:hypothetical protein